MQIRRLPFLVMMLAMVMIGAGVGYVAHPLLAPLLSAGPAASAAQPADDPAGAVDTDVESRLDLGPFWQAWELLERDFLGEDPSPEARRYGLLRGLVESYEDPYTFFVEPQTRQFESDNLRGSFGGIGAYIIRTDAGFTLDPIRDQPAAIAGIVQGDRLLKVDGAPIEDTMSEDDVVALVRGEVGTDVLIELVRSDENDDAMELTFSITRAVIETPSVTWRLLDDLPENANVGYINQTLFSERSAEEMRQAIGELVAQGADRFVLDLRGNPGGLVEAASDIVHIWLDEGVIYREERADGTQKSWSIDPAARQRIAGSELPLVLIVDSASASASEIVAGALQDNGRARLVGQQTFGKGSVQYIHELMDASSLHVTTAQWFTPDGHAISGTGLTPDFPIEGDEDPIPVAIELIQER